MTGDFLFLWHPQVHEFYNERLYYFALRFSGYSREAVYSGLKDRLFREGIVGVCIYEVFGVYDLLLRTWLTPAMYSTFLSVLQKTTEVISNAAFRVDLISHWGFLREPNSEILKEVISARSIVEEAQEDAAKKRLSDKLQFYQRAGVAYCAPRDDDNKEKFYSAVSFRRDTGQISIRDQKRVRDTLLNIQKNNVINKGPISDLSIYFGEGFNQAQILLKGVCENAATVQDFLIENIHKQFAGYSPETTTFIICQSKPYESDNISKDALDSFLTGTPPLWIQSWFPEFYKLGADVDTLMEMQRILNANRATISGMSESHRMGLIKPFIEGILTNDSEKAISPLLLWFARFESVIRSQWFKFLSGLSSLGGKELDQVELDIRGKLGLLREQLPENKRTLGNWLDMYFTALKIYNPTSDLLSITPQPAELTNVRNEVAHGALFNTLKDQWKRVLELLLWIIPVYEGLQNYLKTVNL